MCILFIKREKEKTVLLLNRDEFFDRETQSMSLNHDVYSGRDLVAGGTWMLVNKQGQFAVVTNIRKKGMFSKKLKSRGELPCKVLGRQFIDSKEYNPFNLMWGNQKEFFHQSSFLDEIKISEEIFGISNGVYPNNWPKVNAGKKKLQSIDLSQPNDKLYELFSKIMKSERKYSDVPQETGFSYEQEVDLSSIFVKLPQYGTVSTTFLIMEPHQFTLHEMDYMSGKKFHETIKL